MFKTKTAKIKLTVLSLLFVFLITAGFGCQSSSTEALKANQPVTLKYWRVWDDSSDFSAIIKSYQAIHPNVKIDYRKFRYEEYEQALLEALAEDRGPDILSLHDTWINKYRSKLAPAPEQVTLPYPKIVKRLGIKEETVVDLQTTKLLTVNQLKSSFLDTIYPDVVWPEPSSGQNRIYGVPLSVDTLVLFYNRDILNRAGIAAPPATWVELQNQVKKIVKQGKGGEIIQAGAALGTANNVPRSFDILSVLMMQDGAQMANGTNVTFNDKPANLPANRTLAPGEEALIFYTDFAYPAKEVYTWNEEMPDALEAFLAGQTAFFFGYAYHWQEIKSRGSKLNFSYTGLPQIEDNPPVNYANYWVETVSKKSAKINWAWDFIQFAASAEQVKKYLDRTDQPTALRSLLDYQGQKEDMLPFVSQLLTARSWYRGRDPEAAETIFKEMITGVVKSERTPREAVNLAAKRIQQTM